MEIQNFTIVTRTGSRGEFPLTLDRFSLTSCLGEICEGKSKLITFFAIQILFSYILYYMAGGLVNVSSAMVFLIIILEACYCFSFIIRALKLHLNVTLNLIFLILPAQLKIQNLLLALNVSTVNSMIFQNFYNCEKKSFILVFKFSSVLIFYKFREGNF